MTVLLWIKILAVLLVGVGLAGVLLPVLPGTILVFAGLLLAAWADGFSRVGAGTLTILGVLAAASYTVDMVAAALGVRRLGASRRAAAGAAIGTLAGLFFGLPGVIVGPFAGAVIAELTAHRDLKGSGVRDQGSGRHHLARAGRAGVAAWIGFIIGAAIKFAMVFAMLGIFLLAYFF